MNKRTLERLRRVLTRSRLEDLATWYCSFRPTVDAIAVPVDLADRLDEAPDEAAELGVTPLGGSHGTARRYIYARGAGRSFILYPHG
jgi:hypothetical protein